MYGSETSISISVQVNEPSESEMLGWKLAVATFPRFPNNQKQPPTDVAAVAKDIRLLSKKIMKLKLEDLQRCLSFISRTLVRCLAGSGVVVVGATTERFHRFQPLLTFFTDTQAQAGQKVGLSWILSLSLGLHLFRKESFPKSEYCKHCGLFSSLANGSGIAESFWRSQTKECSSLCSQLAFYMQTLGMTFFSFLIVLWILLTVWCSSCCYLWWYGPRVK